MEKPRDNLQAALDATEKGYDPVAMLPGQKIPAEAWARWLTEEPTEESIYERWQGTRNGIALVCRDLVVIDVDDANELDFALESCGKSPCICKTPRGGFHVHYRQRKGVQVGKKTDVKGREIDILAGAALGIIPHSANERGVPYEWLHEGLYPKAELPVVRIGWSRERARKRVVTTVTPAAEPVDPRSLIYRGQRYIDTFEQRAVSGQNGHRSCFIAARKIAGFVRKLGGSPEDAWQLLLYYNATKCDPPWDLSIPRERRALEHKLKDALK
jgi:hypothetical protein